MTPLRQIQPMQPLAAPEVAGDQVRMLAEQSAQQLASLAMYRPHTIATADGRVFNVLAVDDPAQANTEPFPPDNYVTIPGSESSMLAPTAQLARANTRIVDLDTLSTTHTWHPVTTDADGYEVEALAQFVGWTRAVPFTVHWLPTSRAWYCIGGKFTQTNTADGRTVTITIPTMIIDSLDSGLIGILFTLAEGDPDSAWMATAAEWISTPAENRSQSALGKATNDGTRSAGRFFSPLYAVTTQPVRVHALGWLQPSGPGLYAPFLTPSGISGTLLRL